MENKNVLPIIKFFPKKEDKIKMLKKFKNEIELWISSIEFFESEEDKIYLLMESGDKWELGVNIMPHIKLENRRLVVVEKCTFKKEVCDAFVKSFKIEEHEDKGADWTFKYTEETKDNQNLIDAIGRYVKKFNEE